MVSNIAVRQDRSQRNVVAGLTTHCSLIDAVELGALEGADAAACIVLRDAGTAAAAGEAAAVTEDQGGTSAVARNQVLS